jgi:hypothetical protein
MLVAHYVSAEMRQLLDLMAAGWALCVKDYSAWRERDGEREAVSPIVVGQLLSERLVRSVGRGTAGEYRYVLSDEGEARGPQATLDDVW